MSLERYPTHPQLPFEGLSDQERETHPRVIYVQESDGTEDKITLVTALEAAQAAGLPLVGDIRRDEESGNMQAIIRSSTERGWQRESALMHGATVIAGNTMRTLTSEGVDASEVTGTTRSTTEAAIRQITDNPTVSEAFSNFYPGGILSDEKKFVGGLLANLAEYDESVIESTVTGSTIVSLSYQHDEVEVPYEERRTWYDKDATEILDAYPQFDYRRLRDPDFAQSDEGQKLKAYYTDIIRQQVMRDYDTYPRPINDEGAEVPRAVAPLSQYPLIEALVVDEASISKPFGKYDFSARHISELIAHSDSVPAHRALIESVTHRLPQEMRHAWDGPDELQHKHGDIASMAREYLHADDPDRRAQFREYLVEIFDAYTGDGAIVQELMTNYDPERSRYNRDYGQVKDIVKNMLKFSLVSEDPQTLVGRYMPDLERALATTGPETNPLALTKPELVGVLFDALKDVRSASQPQAFEHLGQRLFGDQAIAGKLRHIAALRQEAHAWRERPDVMLVWRDLRRAPTPFGGEEKPEYTAAKEAFDAATAPADKLFEQATEETNALLFDRIKDQLDSGDLGNGRLLETLIAHVDLGSTWKADQLPKPFGQLTELAAHPNMPDTMRSKILWKFSEAFKYTENAYMLVPIVMDGYRLMLGDDPENPKLPNGQTSHGLEAIAHLAYENRRLFKYANEDQLQLLTRYKLGMAQLIDRLGGKMLTDGRITLEEDDSSDPDDWEQNTAHNLEYTVRAMNRIEEHYKEYLYIERVKVEPAVYYPWVINEMKDFYWGLQWEVGEGNRPTPDISALHNVVKDYVDRRLTIQDEYPEDFDVVEQGQLDGLLYECWQRMVPNPGRIHYNNTVWQKGLPFTSHAVTMMPESVVEQIAAKHGENSQFVRYIRQTRDYYKRDEE